MMTKLLIHLIVLHSCILLSHAVSGQCGYKTTIHTNNNYCVGSSLIVTSIHALQKITWYQNGRPVSTVTGSQSLSSEPVQLPVGLSLDSVYSEFGDVRLGTDDSDNIYILYDVGHLLKAKEQGTISEIAYIPDASDGGSMTDMYVDPAGDVYLPSWNTIFSTGTTTLVWEVPAGSVSARLPDIPSVMPISAIPDLANAVSCIFVDCQKNIYLYNPNIAALYRYSPGAATATLIGSGIGTFAACGGYTWGYGAIHEDQAGNIFFISGSYVMKLASGATAPTVAVPGNCARDDNRLIYDFYLDGQDTIYLTGFNYNTNTAFVEKWAPGAAAAQPLFSFPLQKSTIGNIPITIDRHGNFFLGYNNSSIITAPPNLYEYKRVTVIDSAFTPTDTGSYYAVVTDIRGYTATSDSFHVNAPDTAAPSIQVTATATSTPVCTPISFTAQVANPGTDPTYQWVVSGVPAGGDSSSYSYNLFANGDPVYCILSTQAGCAGPVQDTSNIIDLSIDPQGDASVTIATPEDAICQGAAVMLTATVTNGSNNPAFEWLVNGDSTGDDSSTFTRSNFSNNDVVTCLITSDDACGLAKSNSIPLTVSIPPVIQRGQIFTIPQGSSLQLDPVISGTVDTWAWSPGSWLSDSSIADPVSDPPATVTYTLMVEAKGGCGDTATILVDVFTPLAIPNAFTPNGDGRNDRFYVLGGPVNSVVENFEVFNRWGQAVFRVHDAAPGDASAGWDGRANGSFVAAGTYVYVVVIRFAAGTRQVYRGTVEVIR